jgi:tRNA modification GTPase
MSSGSSPNTIYAVSTGRGAAGVAVIRLSGPAAFAAAQALTDKSLPLPRQAALRRFRHPTTTELLDMGLLLLFPGPHSFTGEDVAELHIHGGLAVVAGMLDALAELPELAAAQAGAFTRRAFDNNRLDLTEVEGLADLIAAETEGQRRQALRQMQGALGALVGGWRDRLVRALAYVEADIDFGEDEGDVPEGLGASVRPDVVALAREISAHLATEGGRGERLRDGLVIAILGPPNAGKSSLINAIARRDVAIVSDIAGTTRDAIEVRLNLGGAPVSLIDTAGLRDSADPIEQEGMRRARAAADQADAVIWLEGNAETVIASGAKQSSHTFTVMNKVDLTPETPSGLRENRFYLSAKNGDGVDVLLDALTRFAAEQIGETQAPAITRAYQREALHACQAALARALAQADPVLAAEDLRLAVRALGRITGRVDVEDLLDVIFSAFCIGK